MPFASAGGAGARPDCWIVVPCYNEELRLDVRAFREFSQGDPATGFLFVNDGSTDRTLEVLRGLEAELPKAVVFDQQPNAGKAAAVRTGMLECLRQPGAAFIGYWDADLATPLAAIHDLLGVFEEHPHLQLVMGSRVKLLGRNIERRAMRHYLGRVFATFASVVLSLAVYDTQCGAKIFRVTPDLAAALKRPFQSRWIFDVELIARLLRVERSAAVNPENTIFEFPLHAWRDVPGSKLKPADFLRAIYELYKIRRDYRQQELNRDNNT